MRGSVGFGLSVAAAAFKGAARLGVKNAEQAVDAAISLDVGLLVAAERPDPRLGRELVHAVAVSLAEPQGQQTLGRGRRQSGLVRPCKPREDRGFAAG